MKNMHSSSFQKYMFYLTIMCKSIYWDETVWKYLPSGFDLLFLDTTKKEQNKNAFVKITSAIQFSSKKKLCGYKHILEICVPRQL